MTHRTREFVQRQVHELLLLSLSPMLIVLTLTNNLLYIISDRYLVGFLQPVVEAEVINSTELSVKVDINQLNKPRYRHRSGNNGIDNSSGGLLRISVKFYVTNWAFLFRCTIEVGLINAMKTEIRRTDEILP